jgi:hypothetical protein
MNLHSYSRSKNPQFSRRPFTQDIAFSKMQKLQETSIKNVDILNLNVIIKKHGVSF